MTQAFAGSEPVFIAGPGRVSSWVKTAGNILDAWRAQGHDFVLDDWAHATKYSKGVAICADAAAPHVRKYRAYELWVTSGDRDPVPPEILSALGEGVVVVPSSHNARIYARHGIEAHVVPHGVDTKLYRPGPIQPGPFTFLFIGDGRARKGVDLLVKAFRLVQGDCKLLLRGEFSPGLTREDARIVVEPRRVPEALMPSVYQRAHCYVTATRGEAFGVPVLEAMACGLPVVAPRWGGYLDFLREEHGRLVPAREVEYAWETGERVQGVEVEPQELASAMEWVMDHRGEARRRGLEGNGTAQGFDWGRVAQNLWTFINP